LSTLYAIYRRELKSAFGSPVAYIILVVFLLITGWFFSTNLFLRGQADLRTFFSMAPFILLFFAPAMTMRLISEEKREGTLEVLATLPVRDVEIVAGKFLAVLTVLCTAYALTLVYPLTVASLGDLDWGPVIGGYVGLVLLGASYLAIGVFASSVTHNQVVAFIVGFLILFVFFMADKILMIVPSFLVPFVQGMSAEYHFENIARGVIDTRDVIYYASVIFLAQLLTVRVLESRKWS